MSDSTIYFVLSLSSEAAERDVQVDLCAAKAQHLAHILSDTVQLVHNQPLTSSSKHATGVVSQELALAQKAPVPSHPL